MPTFLRFFARNLDTHQEILLTQRLVCFDIICSYRTGRPYYLFSIFNIADSPGQFFHKIPYPFCKLMSSIFKIILFLIFPVYHFSFVWNLMLAIWCLQRYQFLFLSAASAADCWASCFEGPLPSPTCSLPRNTPTLKFFA